MIKKIDADKLKVKIYDTRKSLGENAAEEAAARIAVLLGEKPEISIIFAAAPSQNEFLEALLSHSEIDWGRINAFHMDEYIGLPGNAPQGFGNFLRERLFGKAGFKSVNYLDGNASSIETECIRYSDLLTKFPADIVCMGIGENGHIAFNDPHVAFFKDSRLVKTVELDHKCRMQQVNDGCFESIEKVPVQALTLTIPALMACTYIFCMVPGRTKTEAVTKTVTGDITEACPASILRTHENSILYADADSAAGLL